MRLLFVIIAMYLLMLGFADCIIEKRIQVKAISLKIKSIEPVHRSNRADSQHIVWIDDDGKEYDMYCDCPNYKIADVQIFLVTR